MIGQAIIGSKVQVLSNNKVLQDCTIINVGSVTDCNNSIRILESRKPKEAKVTDISNGQNSKIGMLNIRIQELTEKNVMLSKKVDLYKSKADKYDELMAFITAQNNQKESAIIINSTDEIMIDPDNPTITILRYQFNRISSLKNYRIVISELIDFLFEVESYRKENYSKLLENYPQKIKSIIKFVMNKFPNLRKGDITKTISNKCRNR